MPRACVFIPAEVSIQLFHEWPRQSAKDAAVLVGGMYELEMEL
tara:strand:- start:453 stop:581 length:129 start_codon:yes stop_codon:yes gene_type:complete